MVKKKKKENGFFGFRLPKLRKKEKVKIKKVIIKEVKMRRKPISEILTERKKQTAERIARRRM